MLASPLPSQRSPSAYEANPEDEKALYKHNTDKTMTMIRVHEAEATPAGKTGPSNRGAAKAARGALRGRGMLNWFAVHPVSMNNTNPYLSGDNKGAAEQFTEKWAARQAGLGPGFVAAFAQNNGADTTPNVQGAFCLDSGGWYGWVQHVSVG